MKVNIQYKPDYIPQPENFLLCEKQDGEYQVFKIVEQQSQGKDGVVLIAIDHARKANLRVDYHPNKDSDIKEGRAVNELIDKIRSEYKDISVIHEEDAEMTMAMFKVKNKADNR